MVGFAGRNHNRFSGRRLKNSGGSRRDAAVSVRTARETGKASRLELGGSPDAKFFC